MIPFIVLFTSLSVKSFVLHAIPIGLAAFLLAGGLGPVVLTLAFFFLVPSLAMGHLYKRGRSAKSALLAGFVIILAQLLLEMVLFSMLFDIDLKAELAALLADNFKQLEAANLFEPGWAANAANEISGMVMNMLPMLLLTSSFLFAIIAHGLSRRALRTVGFEAPALPEAKTWRVSKSMIVYLVVALIASYAMSEETGGYWWIAVMNLVPILELAFVVQAIGFAFFLADAMKASKVLPVLACVPILLFAQISFIVGLVDAAFPLRKFIVK